MALLDFLKNKKQAEKAKEKKSSNGSGALVTKKAESAKDATTSREVNSNTKGFSYSIVKEPHISEKANNLSAHNQYVFKIIAGANKPEIKKSIEGLYGVNVLNVNIIKARPKKRRIGRTEGFKKGFTKAIVTIKEGQKIEIF